jgi:hypothetical protein
MHRNILLAALLIGAATATLRVSSWTNTDSWSYGNWASVGYEYDLDLIYGTGYEGGNYDGSDAPVLYPDSFNYEKYYLTASSYLEVGFTIELFNLYTITPRFYIEPFEVHPWE